MNAQRHDDFDDPTRFFTGLCNALIPVLLAVGAYAIYRVVTL